MARLVSLGVLIGILIAVTILFYQVMSSFLLPLFLAALVVVVFGPLYRWLLPRCRAKRHVAAAVATVAVGAIAILPAAVLSIMAAGEALSMSKRFDANQIEHLVARVRRKAGLDMPMLGQLRKMESTLSDSKWDSPFGVDHHALVTQVMESVEELDRDLATADLPWLRSGKDAATTALAKFRESAEALQKNTQVSEDPDVIRDALVECSDRFHDFRHEVCGGDVRAWAIEFVDPDPERLAALRTNATRQLSELVMPFANATTSFLAKFGLTVAIMFVAIFFFFKDGDEMSAGIMRLIPLDPRHQLELLDEFTVISRAVVLATLLAAVAQGLLTGIGLWFVGMHSVIFLTLLAIVASLVPFLGAMIVWVPASLWLLVVEDRSGAAIGLALYGFLVVSQSDNVIKPLMLRGRSNVHPLLALLSILGSVQVMGAIGILVGPMLVVFLQTLLKLLHREITTIDAGSKTPSVAPKDRQRRQTPVPMRIPSPSMRQQLSGIIRTYLRP